MLRASDLMTKQPITASNVMTVHEAMHLLHESTIRHLPVVDAKRRVIGMLSDRDLASLCVPLFSGGEYLGTAQRALDTPVGRVMTAKAVVVTADTSAAEIVELMLDRKIGAVIVVQRDHTLLGIVSYLDVLRRIAVAESMAADIMTKSPYTVRATAALEEAIHAMQSLGLRHVPVVDDEGYLAGILSERDLGAWLSSYDKDQSDERTRLEPAAIPVSELMTADVICVDEDAEIEEITLEMIQGRIGAVPVVDGEGRVIGIVSYVDVLRAALANLGWAGEPAHRLQL